MINYQNMKCLLENILVEDKLSDLQSRYKDIHPDTIKDIWNNGVPSNNQGRYIDWSVKENNKSHNPTRTKNALEVYDRNKDKIGKFNHQWSIDDLESVTHPFTDEGKSFNKKADEGTSIHYEDNDIIVRQHSNHESAVKAGILHPNNDCYNSTNESGKAQWCVSSNSENGKNNFSDYTNNGINPLYTIENKKNKTKSAVVFPGEFRDEHDKQTEAVGIIHRHPSVLNSELGNKLLDKRHTKEALDLIPVNATESDLLKVLKKHSGTNITSIALNHPNATENVLLKGLEDDDPDVKETVLRHKHATEKVLLKGLDDTNPWVNEIALTHKNATENVLLKGLDSTAQYVRATALRHKNATEKVLLKGLEDSNPTVRTAALNHPKATEDMLLKGLSDTTVPVRRAAVYHSKATEDMLLKGLEDSNPIIRSAALNHPKTTEDMLLKGLDDADPDVRGAAIEHIKATKQVLLKGLNDTDHYVKTTAKQRLST